MLRFTLKQLEYFVAAAETRSIKLASERIGISQPSISAAIAHLERELELQLFVRHHAQGLSLTSSGKRLMREAKLLLRQADGLYTIAGEIKNEIRGQLSVGCMVTLAPMIVPELGHAFTEAHSGVTLEIVEGDHENLLTQLRQVKIDAAISYDLECPDDVTYEPLASLPAQVLLAREHPLARQASIKLSELEGRPMILLDLPHSRDYFFSIFQSAGLVANVYARSSSQDVVRSMVANGYGFAIVNARPRSMTSLDGRKLVAVKLAGRHKPMRIGLATLFQKSKPMILEAFEKHCRSMITEKSIPGMAPLHRARLDESQR